MWKWIAGSVLLVIVLLAGTCYYGYRKLTDGGGATVVMIGATPERVYASIADPDSLATWVDVGSTVTSSRHGLLEVGDSFTIRRSRRGAPVNQRATACWRSIRAVSWKCRS